jgi:hypothetical protein
MENIQTISVESPSGEDDSRSSSQEIPPSTIQMKPESWLPCLQQPVAGPYPEPVKSITS